jgi:hypothetical protein
MRAFRAEAVDLGASKRTMLMSFGEAERRGIWVFAGRVKNPDPSALILPDCVILPHRVILSGGVVREANDTAVEGPRCCQFNRETSGNSHSKPRGILVRMPFHIIAWQSYFGSSTS